MPPVSPQKIYVAIVDDDESFNRSLSRLLRATGYQPVSYVSAAGYFADTHRPQFGCLILDVELGYLSGIELHRQLNAAGSRIPVIYLTAQDSQASREQAMANGGVGYFIKTDPSTELLETIRRTTTAG